MVCRYGLPEHAEEEHEEDEQRGNAAGLPQLALTLLVHFTDDQIVADVLLDGVFESFHVVILNLEGANLRRRASRLS